jgi:natural product biosynthesis luciferase-like monooxygenase protein
MSDLSDRLAALPSERRELLLSRLRSQGATSPPAPDAPATTGGGGEGDAPGFSLFFFSAEQQAAVSSKYDLVLDSARFGDAHGFEAVWVPERHFDPFGAPFPSPAVLAGAIAATTDRIGVRAGSVVLPLHDPVLVAEEWAMIDHLSGGRVGLSVASGWHANDFVLAPDRYESRRQVSLESLETLQRLWAGETVRRRDGSGTEIDVTTYPRPRTSSLPVWLTTASNEATWRAAGRLGLNVLTALLEQTVEEVADRIGIYKEELAAHGHAEDTAVTVMLHTFVSDDAAEARSTVHKPLTAYLRQHIDLYAKYAQNQDLGIDVTKVTEADKAGLVEMAFQRYVHTSGLFGSPESCLPMVRRLRDAGVTEIACLIDFGLPNAVVLENLPHLDRLRELAHEDEKARSGS